MAETSTLTAMNALFHKKFSKETIATRDQAAVLFNLFKKVSKEQINFQSKAFPVMTDRSGSFTGAVEYDDFPEAIPPTYDQWLPQLRYILSTGSFSHLALVQNGINGVNGKELIGVGKQLGQRVSDEFDSFMKRISASAYRDGKGKISSAISAVTTGASGTFTVPATSDYGVELFSIGLPIEFRDSAGTIHNQSGADPVSFVTAVNLDTGVVTCDNIPTDAAIGDFPVYSGSYDLIPHGIESNIQNQDTTVNGLNVTGLSQLKGNVVSRSGNAFSIRDINKVSLRAMKFAGTMTKVSDYVFLMNPTMHNSYLNEAYAQSTIQTDANRGSKSVDLLYDSVTIGGKKVYLDNDAPRTQVIGLKLDTWRYFYALEPQIIKPEGSYLHLQNATSGVGHRTGFNYYMSGVYNLVCLNPAANFRLTGYDISDTYF